MTRGNRRHPSLLAIVFSMEGSHVPANAERIVAAEATELAAELVTAVGAVDVSHVSLHVGLVHALVRAVAAGELRAVRA